MLQKLGDAREPAGLECASGSSVPALQAQDRARIQRSIVTAVGHSCDLETARKAGDLRAACFLERRVVASGRYHFGEVAEKSLDGTCSGLVRQSHVVVGLRGRKAHGRGRDTRVQAPLSPLRQGVAWCDVEVSVQCPGGHLRLLSET